MTEVVVAAVLLAVGIMGTFVAVRAGGPPLDAVWATWQGPPDASTGRHVGWSVPASSGSMLAARVERSRWITPIRMRELLSALSVTGSDLPLFASRLIVTVGACAVGPFGLWFILLVIGFPFPLGLAAGVAAIAAPLAVLLAVAALARRAADRRRHFRVVIASFVDLVVLGLAGGVGIDGALFAAAQVTPDWAARRLARALLTARDSGVAPWTALAAVGDELGVSELVELSHTVQLAGTEGARIRQSLTARGASLRRHEQAEAESAANAMTERLFLPGALLLLGFLLFIGFPAVHRILGGF